MNANTCEIAATTNSRLSPPTTARGARWNCIAPAWFVVLCFVWANAGLFA